MTFHETRFPTNISLGSEGGPERRTEIVALGSGHEERNSRWADSRRRYNAGYNAGYGVKSIDDLYQLVDFFEERRGQLYGFRWKDITDHKSTTPANNIAATDQALGTGDGTTLTYQLQKTYGSAYAPYNRAINKPVLGTVKVALDGEEQEQGIDYTLDHTIGVITFSNAPGSGVQVTAGFEFDVPVRFDIDRLSIDMSEFNAGRIPNIPIVEIRV